MSDAYSREQLEAFFVKQSPTAGLFLWLAFRRHIQTTEPSQLSEAAGKQKGEASPLEYVQNWQAQQLHRQTQALLGLRLLTLVAALFGVVSMVGVLNYASGYTVNVWLPLLFFVLMPLLASLVALGLLVGRKGEAASLHSPLFNFLLQRWQLSDYQPFRPLVFAWLAWRLQALAIAFSLTALLTFAALAVFQEYRFVWSSTLMSDGGVLTWVMQLFTWPWQSLMVDIDTLVRQTHAGAFDSLVASVAPGSPKQLSAAWWWHLFILMAVYGVLPRVCLAFWLKRKVVRALTTNIQNSPELDQLQRAYQHQVSQDAVTPTDHPSTPAVATTPKQEQQARLAAPVATPVTSLPTKFEQATYVTWQLPNRAYPVERSLGAGQWQEDEAWINQQNWTKNSPVVVLVEAWQTPTGDLADCLEDLATAGAEVYLALVSSDEADGLLVAERKAQQQSTWQLFAQRQACPLLALSYAEGVFSDDQ